MPASPRTCTIGSEALGRAPPRALEACELGVTAHHRPQRCAAAPSSLPTAPVKPPDAVRVAPRLEVEEAVDQPRVASLITTVPGSAILPTCAAMRGVAPTSTPDSPATTRPLCRPMRTCSIRARLDDRQPGVHRSPRVVLVHLRVAEVRHQPVAGPLRDPAVVAFDDLAQAC